MSVHIEDGSERMKNKMWDDSNFIAFVFCMITAILQAFYGSLEFCLIGSIPALTNFVIWLNRR